MEQPDEVAKLFVVSFFFMDLNVAILPSLRLTNIYCDASSALLYLVIQWLDFIYSRSHNFRYGRKSSNAALTMIELMTSALAGVQGTC